MGKLSSYTAATSVADADLLEISQESGGNYTTKKITAANALGSAVGLLSATAGTVTASKAVVVDASKNAGDFNNLDCVNLDAGASAVAGTVDVFPTTASCGKLSLTSSNASGNYNTVVTTATSMGQSSTITIPDPGAATANFLLSAGAQTIAGAQTFSAKPLVTVNDATANAVVDVLQLTHSTSGTAAAGIGTGISIQSEDASGNVQEIVSIDSTLTTATHGSEDADVIINAMLNGTMTPAVTIDASDQSLTIGQNATDADNIDKLRIYSQTASRGSLMIQATANTGDTVTSITNAAHGQATALTIPDIGQATGNIVLLKAAQTTAGELKRADLTEDALQAHGIPVNQMMAADGAPLAVAASAASGDHYLVRGTNTINWYSQTGNGGNRTDVSYIQFVLPPSYVAAGDVTLRIRCKVDGAGDDNASSIDVEAYEQADGAVGADICATAAQTFAAKSTWYNKDFTITATGLVAGDVLNFKITTVCQENGSDGELNVIGEPVKVLLDIKG